MFLDQINSVTFKEMRKEGGGLRISCQPTVFCGIYDYVNRIDSSSKSLSSFSAQTASRAPFFFAYLKRPISPPLPRSCCHPRHR